MLLYFSVENYKIFRDRTTLLMDASADKDHINNYSTPDIPGKKCKVLKATVIYGANASGKTKLFEALSLMRNFVLGSQTHMDNINLNYTPHPGFNECLEKPTSFEVNFIHDGIRYVYGFSYDRTKITEEHLYHYPKGKEAIVFKRNKDEYFFTADRMFQQGNSRRVKSNALYVSVSSQFNHDPSKKVAGWFYSNVIMLINSQMLPNMVHLLDLMNNNKKFAEYTIRALRIADFGIDSIYDRNPDRRKNNVVANQSEPFIGPEPVDIWVRHHMNGKPVEFPLLSESAGTIRFFAVIGPVIDALLNGKTLVVDEMDLSFHTDICEWILGLFLDPAENRHGAQLIFNTHDVELLDLNKVRRDQIWFISKDNNTSVATLARLSEFKGIRKDLDIKKAYMNGSFGAKPYIEPSPLMR